MSWKLNMQETHIFEDAMNMISQQLVIVLSILWLGDRPVFEFWKLLETVTSPTLGSLFNGC